jgi:cobalt/nickel transport system permease protein
MHLGNGIVTPACAAMGFGAAALGAALAWKLDRLTAPSDTPRPSAGALSLAAAAVFAAQTMNFTLVPQAVSAHLVGGFLLAAWFGPLRAVLGMGVVLAVQGLLYADGGLMSWGWNVVTMGCVPALAVYPLWHRWTQGRSGRSLLAGAAAAGWAAVLLGAVACGLVLMLHPQVRGRPFLTLGTVVGVHAFIGLFEGILTAMIFWATALLAARLHGRRTIPALAASAAVLGLTVLGRSPLVSRQPDGLDFSLNRLGLTDLTGRLADTLTRLQQTLSPWPDYDSFIGTLCGASLVGVAAWLLARATRHGPRLQPRQGRS